MVTTVPFGQWIVHHPDKAGGLLRFGMNNLIPNQQRQYDFVDRSYRILLLGIGARAHGYEIAVPLENVNKVVKLILSAAAAWNHPDKDKHDRCVFTSPFSLRFVKSGPQFIGTNGRERVGAPPSDIWCFIEIPRLWIPDEKEKKREFPYYPNAAVQMIWGALPAVGVRSHWGQQEFMARTRPSGTLPEPHCVEGAGHEARSRSEIREHAGPGDRTQNIIPSASPS